ncbi:VOC family protein [Alicyclobacillus sp. SO9]|uniref:VOC family protein n=1 Tax=Alicyclobacillus sp. SO9 TaxID=2665646 RepID=UPI001E35255F|nr:VOC family protein [Alicyclobacillus sp. SO9]
MVSAKHHTVPSQSERTGYLHHVEVNVSHLESSIQFWGWLLDYLGYQLYQEWSQGQSWKKGNTYIVFVQTVQRHLETGYHRKRTGLNHLAFHAESREEVDELTQVLRTRGIPILYESSHPYAGGPEHYAVFFEDPDRIKVELVAPE